MICPNKNSREWKQLVNQVGNRLANMAFVSNGYEIPDVQKLSDIKKDIKWPARGETENFANVSKNLLIYNKKHGTSHSFTKERIFGNTFKLTLNPNYLSVNAEKQRQRLALREADIFKVEDFRTEGFENVYTPSISEQAAGWFNEEGDFLPNADKLPGEINTDELVSGAPSRVTDAEKVRKQKIEKEIARLKDALNQTSDATEYTKIHTALENKIIELKGDPVTTGAAWNDKSAIKRIEEAKKIQAYETILKIADAQLKEVEELIANDAVSYENVQYSQRIVNLWLVAGDFTVPADEHLLLDEAEFNTESIKEEFRLRKNKSETLQSKLTTLQTDHITKFVRKYTSEDLSVEEIYGILEDAGIYQQQFLNIGRSSDPMLQAIFAAVGEANTKARLEANEIWKNIDNLTKAFDKAGGNFNMFKQLTKNGSETGRLVFRFSPEYFKRKTDLINFAFHQKTKEGISIKNSSNIKKYYDWINRNTITFNSQLLFPDSIDEDFTIPEKFLFPTKVNETEKEAHIKELKKHLGEKGYEFYIKRQKQKIKKFKQKRAAIYTKIQTENPNISQTEKDALFTEWLKENSPYWEIEMAKDPKARKKGETGFYTLKGFEFREQVPRKTINGKETGWYDKNFEKIESNDAYLNYYNFLIETLNQLRYTLPQNERNLLGAGVIPTIKKSIAETFSEKGIMMGITPFWDKFKELQTVTDFATEVSADIDPKTKNIKKYIQIPFIPDTDKRVRDLLEIKKIQYKKETGKAPGKIELDKFREEIKDSLSKEQSWDLTKILKAYSLSTLAHKHKSFIQPQIEMAVALFNKRAARELNKEGRPLKKTRDGVQEDVEKVGGLPRYQSALRFFLDSDFYNTGGRKVEGPTSTKRYSNSDKIKKKELEALLKTETDDEKIAFLKEQLDQLGGTVTMSSVGDMFLKAMTFKGLGWNIFSAFSNIGFGVISNVIQGADGREYSQNNLRKAYMLTLNSVARNATFNAWDGVNGNALKIRTLMDNWDLLKTSNQELYDMSIKDTKMKNLKRFGPMSPQERSEYLNYAPAMIAIMLEFEATNPDGKKVTLWDAYGTDGKVKEGFKITNVDGKEFNELRLIQKIKRVIEMNHGDYMNPLQIKEKVAGRAFSQFRTWMFEGFANRFESGVKADGTPKIDWMLSYGNKNPITGAPEAYVRKGRYRSYTAGQLAVTGGVVGSLVLPGIGTAIGGALGGFIGNFSKTKAEGGIISDILFTLKQLNRKLINAIPYVNTPTEFDKRFSTVDAANMRKNMTELYLLLILTGVGLMLKSMFTDEDEEDDPLIANFLLSQVTRLTTDIKFYTSPSEAKKLTKTALPVFQILEDIATVFQDAAHYFNDDPKDDVFSSGPFKGESKFWIHLQELLPGTVQYKRLERIADKALE